MFFSGGLAIDRGTADQCRHLARRRVGHVNDITFRDVSVLRSTVLALSHISGVFPSGSLTAVLGPNGAGKTTLLDTLAGRLQPSSGLIDGAPSVSAITYLHQVPQLDLRVPITVLDFVAMGAWRVHGAFRAIDDQTLESTRDALRNVGLLDFQWRTLNELSSGQLQRARFAQLIQQQPELILLDEPFTAMDEETTSTLAGLIARWQTESRTIIVVLHDRELARALCPNTLLLDQQVISWGPTEQSLAAHRWRHVA
jgi:zinc/manganese transport system ATP-binding protein